MLDHVAAGPAEGAPASSELPSIVRHRPDFSGRAGEYFGIWFVNLVLSILTLGIYSAWAKVRTERYFYGNTRLAGASFEYLASPIAILKGRLVAYAVVIALGLSSQFAPFLYAGLIAVVGLLMPVIIVLGLRFRARYSAWRGVRFGFDADPADGYGPFLGWPILNVLTLTVLYPVMRRRQQEFVVEHHRLGRERFGFGNVGLGEYYAVYGLAVLAVVVAMVGGIFLVGAVVGAAGGQATDGAVASGAVFAFMGVFYATLFLVFTYTHVRYTNLMWRNARLGAHRFESTLRVRDMLWIYASNLVAIVCTIGMAVPWAMVRLARYRAAHFAVLAHGGLDDFEARAEDRRDATGAELSDALDVGADFGL